MITKAPASDGYFERIGVVTRRLRHACAAAPACIARAGRMVALVHLTLLLAGCTNVQSVGERFAAMPPVDDVVTSTAWYRPTVVVRGARQANRSDRATPQQLSLEPKWSAAIDGAIRYESLSIVVRQHDRLVAEWHEIGRAHV